MVSSVGEIIAIPDRDPKLDRYKLIYKLDKLISEEDASAEAVKKRVDAINSAIREQRDREFAYPKALLNRVLIQDVLPIIEGYISDLHERLNPHRYCRDGIGFAYASVFRLLENASSKTISCTANMSIPPQPEVVKALLFWGAHPGSVLFDLEDRYKLNLKLYEMVHPKKLLEIQEALDKACIKEGISKEEAIAWGKNRQEELFNMRKFLHLYKGEDES